MIFKTWWDGSQAGRTEKVVLTGGGKSRGNGTAFRGEKGRDGVLHVSGRK